MPSTRKGTITYQKPSGRSRHLTKNKKKTVVSPVPETTDNFELPKSGTCIASHTTGSQYLSRTVTKRDSRGIQAVMQDESRYLRSEENNPKPTTRSSCTCTALPSE